MCSCLVDFVLGVVVKVGAVFDSSSFKEFLKIYSIRASGRDIL